MVLPPLDFESSASAISPPRLRVSTDKIIARTGLIKKKIAEEILPANHPPSLRSYGGTGAKGNAKKTLCFS